MNDTAHGDHSDDFRRAGVRFGDMTPPTHRLRHTLVSVDGWRSDHPHGDGQRVRIVETAQVRPGDLEGRGKTHTPVPARLELDALGRRQGWARPPLSSDLPEES
jgi:hypothetical protein